jgi:DNA mismatch endonuclease Vsr
MTPRRTNREVSRIMSLVHSRNTHPEQILSRALRRAGIRFRRQSRNLPGKPDFVLKNVQVAVFVDGDFWHGRQWRLRGLGSLAAQFKNCANKEYWLRKVQTNINRDRRVNRQLRNAGWKVIRIWERDLIRRPDYCLRRVANAMECRNGR